VRCNASEIKELITELCDAIKHTGPRIVPLIRRIKAFETEMAGHYGEDLQETKNEAIRILQEKHDLLRSKVEQVIEHGVNLVEGSDTIVVHTASSDVTKLLVRAKEDLKKNFKLIILKQDFAKTKFLVRTLSKAKIDLLVVPEYSLSHYNEKANKLFIGAVSITPDAKVGATIGTANIVGLCHINRVPVYLFANSLKFPFHPSSSQRIHTETVSTSQDDVKYMLTTHSHDIVDLKLVNHLVTEDGKTEKPVVDVN
jgi:translation initiation factor eIF-2B subunit alpha